MSKFQQRLRREGGFTLIELLVVLVIIGVLLAIAVPSYLGYLDRANKSAAKANLRSAIPAAEAFFADNNTYAAMTAATLRTTYDSGLSTDVTQGPAAGQTGSAFCLQATHGNYTYHFTGPGGTIPSAPNGACL